jgi:hypothetical protein
VAEGSELDKKVKQTLDETRLLILGAQILFGFQFQGSFQQQFAMLGANARMVYAAGLLLLVLTIGLLITPSMLHRITFRGRSHPKLILWASMYAGLSLLPLAMAIGCSTMVVFSHAFGVPFGIAVGTGTFLFSILALYGLAFAMKKRGHSPMPKEKEWQTSLDVRVEQLLTEARVIIPGGQALLGFAFVVMFSNVFAELPLHAKVMHGFALLAVFVAVTLLMTPAAVHRIAYRGLNSEKFYRIGSALVISATLPLALGIAADTYVVVLIIAGTGSIAALCSVFALGLLLFLWMGYPYFLRAHAQDEFARNETLADVTRRKQT